MSCLHDVASPSSHTRCPAARCVLHILSLQVLALANSNPAISRQLLLDALLSRDSFAIGDPVLCAVPCTVSANASGFSAAKIASKVADALTQAAPVEQAFRMDERRDAGGWIKFSFQQPI